MEAIIFGFSQYLFGQVYIIVIVVVSVHAYNLGVVKYDYKILCVVAKILYLEVKKMCVKNESDNQKKVEIKETHFKIKRYLLHSSLGPGLYVFYLLA